MFASTVDFRLSLDFFDSGLYTCTAVARLTLALARLSCLIGGPLELEPRPSISNGFQIFSSKYIWVTTLTFYGHERHRIHDHFDNPGVSTISLTMGVPL